MSSATFGVESKEPEILKKQEIVNFFIKAYQHVKKEYLEREEGSNLIGFFDKNNDNLMGVFASCIDRIYEVTKKQRRQK